MQGWDGSKLGDLNSIQVPMQVALKHQVLPPRMCRSGKPHSPSQDSSHTPSGGMQSQQAVAFLRAMNPLCHTPATVYLSRVCTSPQPCCGSLLALHPLPTHPFFQFPPLSHCDVDSTDFKNPQKPGNTLLWVFLNEINMGDKQVGRDDPASVSGAVHSQLGAWRELMQRTNLSFALRAGPWLHAFLKCQLLILELQDLNL